MGQKKGVKTRGQKVQWSKTSYPGVRYREHATRKHGVNYDRYFVIRYKVDGKTKDEAIGWASDGWTAEKASLERARLRKNQTTGQGPVSLKEERRIQKAEREEAEREEAKKQAGLITVKQFFEDVYLPDVKDDKKPETLEREKRLFKNWIEKSIGHIQIKIVNEDDLRSIRSKMLNEGKAFRTVNTVLAVFRQCWYVAKRKGFVDGTTPTENIFYTAKKLNNERERFLTQDEAKALLDNLQGRSEQVYQMALLSLHCGLRLGEICNLKFFDIDLDQGHLRIRESKSGKSRTAFMTEDIRRMFQDMERGKPGELVFKDRHGEKIIGVSNSFDRAINDLKLNEGIDKKDRKHRVCFHTLRHTYASWLVQSGVSLKVVQELLGHSTYIMTERYSHVDDKALKDAVTKLDNTLTPPPDDKEKEEQLQEKIKALEEMGFKITPPAEDEQAANG